MLNLTFILYALVTKITANNLDANDHYNISNDDYYYSDSYYSDDFIVIDTNDRKEYSINFDHKNKTSKDISNENHSIIKDDRRLEKIVLENIKLKQNSSRNDSSVSYSENYEPSIYPSSLSITIEPTIISTYYPTEIPYSSPTKQPTMIPSENAMSESPTSQPSGQPSQYPTSQQPISQPTMQPSSQPTSQPTYLTVKNDELGEKISGPLVMQVFFSFGIAIAIIGTIAFGMTILYVRNKKLQHNKLVSNNAQFQRGIKLEDIISRRDRERDIESEEYDHDMIVFSEFHDPRNSKNKNNNAYVTYPL